jgi:hypothetical protein
MCELAAVGQIIHKYDESLCLVNQEGHPASHHDPPVGRILRQNYRAIRPALFLQ